MATAIPFGWTVQNAAGTAVSGAKIYFYVPNTTTNRTPYSDTGLSVPTANPVIADSAGWFLVYLSSELAYDIVVKSADDSITYQTRSVASNISGAQPVDPLLTSAAGLVTAEGDFIEATASDVLRVRKLQRQTYAALTAIAAASRFDDMLVYVASRATDGDGGEGWWRFDAASSATANGGTILAPDAGTGRWIRQYTGDIIVKWFGINAAAINAAILAARPAGGVVLATAGEYTLDDTVDLLGGVTLQGEGWEPYTAYSTTATLGEGTIFNVTQTSAPAILFEKPGSGRATGARLKDFAMFWTHAAPTGGWAPTVYDWAIKMSSTDDLFVEQVLLVNPYKGIQITGSTASPAGRLHLHAVYGQPFLTGVDINFSADVTVLDRVHFWPYWSDNANVLSWMKTNNATFLKSSRSDNTQLSNLFGYGYARGIHLSGNVDGVTQRMMGSNIDFDDTERAFWADTDADASSAQFTNFHATANPATTGADLFVSEADGVDFVFSNTRLSNSQVESVNVTGTNAKVRFVNFWADQWNIAAGGDAAIAVGSGARVDVVSGRYTDSNSGPLTSGSGIAAIDEWIAYTPSVAASAGTITTSSATGRYRRVNNTVHFVITATITTNGTGATGLVLGLPFAAAQDSFAAGEEYNSTGVTTSGRIVSGDSTVTVKRYDDGYPGGNSTINVLAGSYEVA